MRLIVSAAAEADIVDAYLWYEKQRSGLGSEFVQQVALAVDAVIYEPLRFPAIHRSIRRALLHRFPYGLFFVVAEDKVVVVAVLHLARNPRGVYLRPNAGK